MIAIPVLLTDFKNSSVLSSALKPGMDSSLSMVPPVCPRPRPDILATGMPAAATMGARAMEVLSPTPPVLCLSTFMPGISDRSSCSPDSLMHWVSITVSSSVIPRMKTAIKKAAAW